MAKSLIPSEHAEQVTFVAWFKLTYPNVLIFAIPNGGLRNVVTAKKLKMEGVVPGVPDLFVPEWKLFIEMKKSKGGRVSTEQKNIIKHLRKCGYQAEVCNGFDDAKKIIENFVDSVRI